MEHGKFSISKIWHIAKMEYIKLIMDPRMILIVAALVFAYQFITVPLLQNAAMMGKPINVYEPFVALLNSNFMILLVPAVFRNTAGTRRIIKLEFNRATNGSYTLIGFPIIAAFCSRGTVIN